MSVFSLPWAVFLSLLASAPPSPTAGSTKGTTAPPSAINPKSSSPSLKEQVARLVEDLDDDQRTRRDDAEKKLIDLGPDVIASLPDSDEPSMSAEQQQRLTRIHRALSDAAVKHSTDGSRISLQAVDQPLDKVLKELETQSGNRIVDLRETLGQERSNPKITVRFERELFWKALDTVLEKGNVSPQMDTEDRSIGVITKQPSPGLGSLQGAALFSADSIILEKKLGSPEHPPVCRIPLSARIEPRLRPLLLEIERRACLVEDDKGRTLTLTGPEQVVAASDRDGYQFLFQIKCDSPPRSVTRLARVAGEVALSLPIRIERFEFTSSTDKEQVKHKRGLSVRLGKLKSDSGLWTVPVTIENASEKPPAASFLQTAMAADVLLQNKEGGVYRQNAGRAPSEDDAGRAVTEYLFADLPGKLSDYRIVVEAPEGIARTPIKFEFNNLPLP